MNSFYDTLRRRVTRVAIFSLLALVTSASFAQQAPVPSRQPSPTPRRQVIPPPPDRSFLDPGPAPAQRRVPNYVADDFVTSPAYGPTDRFGAGELPPKVGEGAPR
jgi:hypothetical protein